MSPVELFLWPGTKFCEFAGIDPESDAGLIRWMVNSLVYSIAALLVAWAYVATQI